MLLIALASHAVRCFGYTRLTRETVWWILALEPLHGITYALMWSAAVDRIKVAFPAAWLASGQLTMSTVQNCVGCAMGSLLGGYWMQHGELAGMRGGQSLYLLAAAASTAVLALHLSASSLLILCGHPPLMAIERPAVAAEDEANSSVESSVDSWGTRPIEAVATSTATPHSPDCSTDIYKEHHGRTGTIQ